MERIPLEKLITDKFPNLQQSVKDIFESEETSKEIDSLVSENQLSEEQGFLIFDEIAYTLFKMDTISSFRDRLLKNIDLEETTAKLINLAVYEKIFFPIKDLLLNTDDYSDLPASNHNSEDILREIENPTPSIRPSTNIATSGVSKGSVTEAKLSTQTSQISTQEVIQKKPTLQEIINEGVTKNTVNTFSDSINNTISEPELGGYDTAGISINPAHAIADKLDQRFLEPTVEIPKEIYHIKKPDPYHEPIE